MCPAPSGSAIWRRTRKSVDPLARPAAPDAAARAQRRRGRAGSSQRTALPAPREVDPDRRPALGQQRPDDRAQSDMTPLREAPPPLRPGPYAADEAATPTGRGPPAPSPLLGRRLRAGHGLASLSPYRHAPLVNAAGLALRPSRRCCSTGTTATAAACPGARAPAAARPLPRLAQRDHAAADDRCDGRTYFPISHASRHSTLAAASLGRCAARLAGSRLLRPRPQSARLRAGRRQRSMAAFSGRPGGCCAACRASAITRRRRSRRSLRSAGRWRWTAMSSGSWPGCSPARRRCPRRDAAARPRRLMCRERRAGDFAQANDGAGRRRVHGRARRAASLCPWRRPIAPRQLSAWPRSLPVRGREAGSARCATASRSGLRRADGAVLLRRRPEHGPARRHDRAADHRLAVQRRRSRRHRRRPCPDPGRLAPHRRHRPPRLHPPGPDGRHPPRRAEAVPDGLWAPPHRFADLALPTLTRRLLTHAGLG